MPTRRLLPLGRCLPLLAVTLLSATAMARQWQLVGMDQPIEAEFVGLSASGVVLKGSNGVEKEFSHDKFSFEDQRYILSRASEVGPAPIGDSNAAGDKSKRVTSLANQSVTLNAGMELHVTGEGDSLAGGKINFMSPDGWLFVDHMKPSEVIAKSLKQMRVFGNAAELDRNLRVARYGDGSVIIPQAPTFPGLTVFSDKDFKGDSLQVKCYEKLNGLKMGKLKGEISSFKLARGYMATIATEENGTGLSKNYVAQDRDIEVDSLPEGFDNKVAFIRVFPWQWTCKKGVAGGIWKDLNVGWFYDWNIGAQSNPDVEYVAIKQKRYWPGMDQDWKQKGINHLLGYNEPDRPDQANLKVDDAIAGWPELLGTGLRLGAPAVSDGGLGWLYQFIDKADAAKLRVDFVAVHYYRGVGDPGDPKAAASQMFAALKGIHDRTKRPIWITEWNNGANWTNTPDPNAKQQAAAVEAMIKMLDDAPFVERYAIYNWVEDCRSVVAKDGSLTPAGKIYHDKESPVFFTQPKSNK